MDNRVGSQGCGEVSAYFGDFFKTVVNERAGSHPALLEKDIMGTWDTAPWDDDSAGDWFSDVMERTKLRDIVVKQLNGDIEDEPAEMRAAVALFVMLGRVYIWPIEHFEADLALAIDVQQRLISESNLSESPEIVEVMRTELAELQSRVKPPKGDGPAPAPSNRSWWRPW